MQTIFNSSKWLSSPSAYWTVNYEYKRNGADMQYRFYWKVWLSYSGSYYYDGLQLQLFLNGTQYNVTVKPYDDSEEGWSYEGTTGWYTVSKKASGSTPFYAKLYDTNLKTVRVTSSTYNLYVIPVAPILVVALNSRTETSITINWYSETISDYLWYSINDGASWTSLAVANVKSGSYSIQGLKANTPYKVRTRIRQKEGQLITETAVLSVTTYSYPYCLVSPDFTIGNSVNLEFYNPMSRTFNFYVVANGTQIPTKYTCSGTSATVLLDANELYKTIPDSQSGNYKIMSVYGSSTIIFDNGNSYSIKGTEVPSVGSLSYKDGNPISTNITEDDSIIIQNQSNILVVYGKATAKNSATIKSYTFQMNEVTKTSTSEGGTVDLGKIDSSGDTTLTMIVTDSRGLTSSTSVNVPMLSYNTPDASIVLARVNNYEDETHLKVDATISDIGGKNSATITYWYKEQDGEYNDPKTIEDRATEVLSVDKTKNYIFQVVVSDAFGTTCLKEMALGKGVFPLFIDTKKNAVGINGFPKEGEALRVVGGVANFVEGVQINGTSLVDLLHPVGSVLTTFTYYSPANYLGGTWTLVSKEFSESSGGGTDFIWFYAESDFVWKRSGSVLLTRFTFTPTQDINDGTSLVIGMIDVEKLGISSISSVKAIGYAKDQSAVFQAEIDDKGYLKVVDVIGKTTNTIPSGSSCFVEFTHIIPDASKLNSACNKFYWKRTA